MKQPEAPCKGCEDRRIGCHIICDKYIKFTHECEIFRAEKIRIAEENQVQYEIESRRKRLLATGGMYKKKTKYKETK